MSGVHTPEEVCRDVVTTIERLHIRTGLSRRLLTQWVGIQPSRYHRWRKVEYTTTPDAPAKICSWELLDEERQAVLAYHTEVIRDGRSVGYRTLTYEMLDNDVVACGESTVYRILHEAGRLSRRAQDPSKKGAGFEQPQNVHEHWHIDISYLWEFGHKAYLVTILDGKSRYVLQHQVLNSMTAGDVEMVLQRAFERFPNASPCLISDNGSQFIGNQFKGFLADCGFTQRRTSVNYPQANGKIERHFRTTKELLRQRSIIDRDDLVQHIDEIVEYYNNHRYHTALGFITPVDAFCGREHIIKQQRRQKLDDARFRRKHVHSTLFN